MIAKSRASFFITKRGQNVLQNAAASLLKNAWMLLQNVASITKCIDFYYRMLQVLQNALIITKHGITNVSYYNLLS